MTSGITAKGDYVAQLVLVADDDPSLRSLYNDYLSMRGYNTIVTRNGEEAIQKYHEHEAEIVLVLTDLRMPKMDGFMLASYLATQNPALPVVAVSAYIDIQEHQERFQGQFSAKLRKPFHLEELGEILDRFPEKPEPHMSSESLGN